MKILILVNVLIALINYANTQQLSSSVLNNNVRFNVSPSYIVKGLSLEVDIECMFRKNSEQLMSSVLSMVIAHSNKTDQPVFNYVTSVNGMDSQAHNLSHDIEVISGSIDNNGESKLHMRFTYPETNLIGLYMCEVTGFDQIGKPLSIYSTVNVVSYNITNVFDALQNAQSNITDLVDALQSANSNIADLVISLYNAQSNITELLDELQNAQTNISALQQCQGANESITHSTFCGNFYPPTFYNGHVYYLSHIITHFNRREMQSKCGVLGGYLVELDTSDEYFFMRDYIIKQLDNAHTVWTGATDENHEGVFINEHNSTSRPAFEWFNNEPNAGTDNNCQCFLRTFGFRLGDCYCDVPFFEYCQYICEIPGIMC